jgi:hypothetical protein
MMELMTTFWTRDSKRVCKLRVARLCLDVLEMPPGADKISGIRIILNCCRCWLISNDSSWYLLCFSVLLAYRLCVNWITASMNPASSVMLSVSVMSGRLIWTVLSVAKVHPGGVRGRRFQYDLQLIFIIWRIRFLKKVKLFHQFLMENFWRPVHVGDCILG